MANIPQKEINDHSFLAEELLIPMLNHTDSGRIQMFTSHSGQTMNLVKPEVPRVFTAFENQVGEYSTGYKSVKSDTTIINIFEFNDNHKLILTKDKEGVYDIIEWKYARNLTESFGYTSQLNPIVVKNAKLEEGTWIHKNGFYDDHLNFQYGRNLKAIFIPFKGKTFEDGIVISESTGKNLSHDEVYEFDIVLNRNDILINFYGNIKKVFKNIPGINEKIKKGILCARRRINISTILDEFKDTELLHINPDDTVFYANGTVADIKVYNNIPEDMEYPYMADFKIIKEKQDSVFESIFNTLSKIKDSKNKVSDNFNFWLQEAISYLNKDLPFSFDGSIFEGTVIHVTVVATIPAKIGSKITGRYGSKGVISAILPDNEMPVSECGKYRADIILNSMGVFGRMNISQNYEQELNFIANYINDSYVEVDTDYINSVMQFWKIASPKMYDFVNTNIIEDWDQEEITEFFQECKDNFIPIHQPPFFDNIGFDGMRELYRIFPAPKIKFKDILEPQVFGEIYYIKLKHEAKKKFSARSSGMTNLQGLPYKSNEKFKKGNAQFNSNPVKMGEQEFYNMCLLEDHEGVSEFLKFYSSSSPHRKEMQKDLLLKDANKIESFSVPNENSTSNSAKALAAQLRGAGMDIIRTQKEYDNFLAVKNDEEE